MKKLFQTLFVLLAITSNSDAESIRLQRNTDANKLLPFSQAQRKTAYSNDIEALYGINEFRAKHIKQPYNEFNRLYENAHDGQAELERLTERVALATHTTTFSSGVKSKQRALTKINNKLAGNSNEITDLIRTSIVAQDVPELMEAFALIEQETQLLRVKNRFKTPVASGYRDLSLLVRLPQSQIVAEVQLHLEAFSVIKNGVEHNNYEQVQQIQCLQLNEQRSLSKSEEVVINKLREESNALYQHAWNQYLSA